MPCRVSAQSAPKPLGAKYSIGRYLCPNPDHNPWCPIRPGMHGYMFVGLGQEVNEFNVMETRHVFVFTGTNQWRYIGIYEASRVDALTVNEWEPLQDHVRHFLPYWCCTSPTNAKSTSPYFQFKLKYSATTKDKSKDSRSETEVKAAYDNGKLRVPCVQLKCVGFDEALYNDLVQANSIPMPSSSNIGRGKRSHNQGDEGSGGSRRKSARTSLWWWSSLHLPRTFMGNIALSQCITFLQSYNLTSYIIYISTAIKWLLNCIYIVF